MRSIWKGAISFGLVSIPVKVVGATENHSVSFRQLHTTDNGRIRYRKVCELEDEEVPGEEIGKGYEAPDGTVVRITDDELSRLPLPTAKSVEILGFVPVGTIDLIQLDRSYYLQPDTGAEKPYVLLREAMSRSGKVAIAKLAMRGRETLAVLRPVAEGVLGMHTMLWPDEIRSPASVAPQGRISVRDAELDLADTLMDTLGEVDMSELHDEYREAVDALVTAKLSGELPELPAERPAGAKVIDLMSALEDSVRAAREARGAGEDAEATVTALASRRGGGAEPEEPGGEGGRPAARRKAPAKKAPAKKAAAKQTSGGKKTAKKAAAGKTAEKKTAAGKTAEKKTAGKKTARKRAS
ncbi:Ku protein [Streptomyces aidingensis]|uniref:Non-homologous end joining protein Ku n=1 Tax=Streptomyces aidingensis TaxID=910347 RepID=A0A1I1RWS6_9ACTN|nr:Ku protein [Streptomyces aidingensis]SFD38824.1 DNA end-binding protein Ku [Streptomyces aidingensis]